jgi:beta-glucosidase
MFLMLYFTDFFSGVDDVNNNASSLKEALNDPIREKSYKDHLKNVLRSIK